MRGVSTFLFNIQCINTTFILKLFYSSNESFVIFASYSIPTIADPETEENSRNLSLSLILPGVGERFKRQIDEAISLCELTHVRSRQNPPVS